MAEDDDVTAADLDTVLGHKDFYSNGVRLRATKAEPVTVGDQPGGRVSWVLDYRGERWPLVILTPSLRHASQRQTAVDVFAVGKDGNAYRWSKYSPTPTAALFFPGPHYEKEWFTKVEKAKGSAEGTIDVPLGRCKRLLRKAHPDQFDDRVPPVIYLRIEHGPTERGKEFELDSWTGTLISAPVKLSLKKW